MLILHVVDPFAAGLATFLKLLTEEMNDNYHIIVHGERAELAELKDIKKIFPRKQIRFIYWKSVQREINLVKDTFAYIELLYILRRFRHADVVHLHSSKAGFLGRIACRQLKIKQVIYTPNGAPFLMNNESNIKLNLYLKLEKLASFFGGEVICSSASEQKEYLKRGIKAGYISNGTKISKDSFISNKDYSQFRIVTSGRVVDQKNPIFFNEIALSLVNLKHFEFVWIGSGEDISALTSPNIHITGWLSKEGVKKEIAKADLYLSTSYFEGLPFAVMEAMALGKCLLLSNCTGNIDLVKKGINGQIFSTKEEAINYIVDFYLNKEITESMGLNSIEICKDYFNIKETASKYQELYLDISKLAYNSLNKVKYKKINQVEKIVVLKH